jgi:hypothetical protein
MASPLHRPNGELLARHAGLAGPRYVFDASKRSLGIGVSRVRVERALRPAFTGKKENASAAEVCDLSGGSKMISRS